MKKYCLHVLAASFILILIAAPMTANKTAVSIEAPATAQKGSSITVKINVAHSGNSFLHYTDWVVVKINGKEVSRWEFTRSARPENENFTRELQIKVDGPLTIEAQGHCNIHGSEGKATVQVALK
jgi:desulfoferrodoxin (superoxide reductase-like protein)